MLATVANFQNPLFWALFIGWVLSVVLHEFAHGLVAYLGGDYTIRERGGLTLNPLQYVDPVLSIVLPIVFLLMGGVPLPGGVTYVRRDLLRSRAWSTAVSAAGPVMNLLLFLALCVALHPRVGWVNPTVRPVDWTPGQQLAGALAFLQLFSVVLNLMPIPPLDGFQMISPYLPRHLEQRLMTPPAPTIGFVVFYLVVSSNRFMSAAYEVMRPVTDVLGIAFSDLVTAARLTLYGHT